MYLGKTVITILLLVVMVSAITGLACFDPSDKYSLEVVLSKPGIKYDLSILEHLRGVIRTGDTYIWRSHVSPSMIVVVVSLQPLSLKTGAEKYISVRVEERTIVVNHTVRIYFLKTSINERLDMNRIEDALREQGWGIDVYSSGSSVKAILHKEVNNTTITGSIILSYTGNKTFLSITFKISGNLNDKEIIDSIKKALSKTMDTSNLEFTVNTVVEQTISPLPNITEELLKKTLRYELKWLTEIGVISGLKQDDIETILNSIREGMAGWNSRLVYFNGKWKPYYDVVKEIPGGALIKTSTGCGWDYPLELLPPTPPQANNNTSIEEATNTTIPQTPQTTHTVSSTTSTSVKPSPTTHETTMETVSENTIGGSTNNSSTQANESTSTNNTSKTTVIVIIVVAVLTVLLSYILTHRR